MTQTPARREAQEVEVRCPVLEREEQLQEAWRVWLAATGHIEIIFTFYIFGQNVRLMLVAIAQSNSSIPTPLGP